MSLKDLSFDELLGLAAYETDIDKHESLVCEINERCEREGRGIVSTGSFDIFAKEPPTKTPDGWKLLSD